MFHFDVYIGGTMTESGCERRHNMSYYDLRIEIFRTINLLKRIADDKEIEMAVTAFNPTDLS